MRELQDDRCFYCDRRLSSRVEVDHFIPWSRWPNDALENLVLADSCNNHKRDHLAASVHAERWTYRVESNGDELASLAEAAGWTSERSLSVATARSAYFHLPAGTPLWVSGGSFADDDPIAIASLIGGWGERGGGAVTR